MGLSLHSKLQPKFLISDLFNSGQTGAGKTYSVIGENCNLKVNYPLKIIHFYRKLIKESFLELFIRYSDLKMTKARGLNDELIIFRKLKIAFYEIYNQKVSKF